MTDLDQTPLQAGLRAVREMPDDAPVEEHLRIELQAAHDRVDALVKANWALAEVLERVRVLLGKLSPTLGLVTLYLSVDKALDEHKVPS